MDSREKKRRASKLCMRKLRARRGIELSIKNSVRSVSISKDDNNRCSDNNFNITTHGNGTENVDNVTDELIDYDCQTSEEEDGQESDENAGENNDGTDDNEHSDDDNMNNGDDHPVQPDVNEGDEEPEPVYENEDDDDDHMTEIGQLKEWATTYHIPQAHLDILLSILRRRLLPGLPKSSKTFLDTTNAQYTVEPMEDADGSMGEFAYIGIEQGLKACVNVSAHDSGILNLQINCDGLQLSKSSCQEIWPLLIKIHSELASYQPFTAALYKGKSKPKNPCDYLKKFILEMNELLANGIEIDQRHFEIRIHCFICDTPARAFIKSTKGHAGFHACERCQVIGYKMDKTTVFTDTNQIPRDDLSFREQSDNDHHTGISPLIFLMPHINMILAFVLDFMHLGFLGVMAKLLDYWCSYKTGKFNISPNLQDEISRRINLIKCQIPSDFQRKLRTLKDYSKYKATELKFFALYAGPILLKDIKDKHKYVTHQIISKMTKISF